MTPAMKRALELHLGAPATKGFERQTEHERALNRIRASVADGTWPQKVAAFRTLFALSQHNLSTPACLPRDRKTLHSEMLQEELNEYYTAGSLADEVDALLDLIYVALGTLSEMGLTPAQIEDGFTEVHASNLTKVDDTGQPQVNAADQPYHRPDLPIGKVLKANHTPPQLLEAIGLPAAAPSQPE